MRKNRFLCLSLILFLSSCGVNNSSSIQEQHSEIEHTHEMSYITYVAPTCTTEGIIEHYHCSSCNKNFEDENGNNELTNIAISTIEHNYVFEEVVEPTCVDAGYSTYKCSMCGKIDYQDFVDAAGHTFDTTKLEHVDPTCTEAGFDKSYCTTCKQYITYNVIDPLGHIDSPSFNPISHKATCEEDGYVLHHCDRCDKDYITDVVASLGHDYDVDNAEVVDATCERAGYIATECKRCHEVVKEYSEQLPHEFVNGVCSQCHNSIEDATLIRAFDRLDPETYVPVNVTKSNTWGYVIDFKSDPCSELNASHYCLINIPKSTIEALIDYGVGGLSFRMGSPDDDVRAFAIEHEGGFPAVNVGGNSFCSNFYTKPIANEDKSLSSLITDDGLSFLIVHGRTREFSGVLPSFALDMRMDCLTHTPRSGSLIHHDATCEEDGYDQYICDRCGATYKTNIVKKSGHDYQIIESYDEATCDHIKGTIYQCTKCYDEKSEIIEDKKNHNFVNGTCSNCHKGIDEISIIKAHDHQHNAIECVKNGEDYLVKAPLSDTYKSYVYVEKEILQALLDCGYQYLTLTPKKANPNNGRTIYIHDENEQLINGANFFANDGYYASIPISRTINLLGEDGKLNEKYKDGFTLPLIVVANGNNDKSDYKVDVIYNKANEIIAANGFNSHVNNIDGSLTVSVIVSDYCFFAIDPALLSGHEVVTINISGSCPLQPVSAIDTSNIGTFINGSGSFTLNVNDNIIDNMFYFGMYYNGTSPFTVSYSF